MWIFTDALTRDEIRRVPIGRSWVFRRPCRHAAPARWRHFVWGDLDALCRTWAMPSQAEGGVNDGGHRLLAVGVGVGGAAVERPDRVDPGAGRAQLVPVQDVER